jgi:ubiquinone/menaquinone biosynthesis C-methylase UbiE
MARESTKSHWDSYWQAHGDPHATYDNDDRVLRPIFDLGDVRGKRILEVGAGSGRDSIELAHRGAIVTVIDYVPSSLGVVAENARRAGVHLNLVCGDGTCMPFDEETFDVVFHQGLMEHFRNPSPLLQDNRRVLKNGGHVVIDVPQRWHIYTVGKKILIAMNRWFAGWETEYSIRELSRIVEGQGFLVTGRFGDWMVPGFFYRAFRYTLRRLGVQLPRHPRGVPLMSQLNDAWRSWLRKKPLAYWTYAMIGVVGRKV